MLSPKKVKYRKLQKGRIKGKATRGNTLAFGDYGLQALEPGKITANQIESARVTINRAIKKGGKMWIRIFPNKSLTKRPAETRMGKGKGDPYVWVAPVKPGTILYEIKGVAEELALRALKLAAYKLPIKAKVVKKKEVLV